MNELGFQALVQPASLGRAAALGQGLLSLAFRSQLTPRLHIGHVHAAGLGAHL